MKDSHAFIVEKTMANKLADEIVRLREKLESIEKNAAPDFSHLRKGAE